LAEADEAAGAHPDHDIAMLAKRVADHADGIVRRSASGRDLVYRVNENAKVEAFDFDATSKSTAPPQADGLTEDEIEGIGIALGTIRNQAYDYADAVEGRLHAELVALRDEVKALRAEIEMKNITPLRGRDAA